MSHTCVATELQCVGLFRCPDGCGACEVCDNGVCTSTCGACEACNDDGECETTCGDCEKCDEHTGECGPDGDKVNEDCHLADCTTGAKCNAGGACECPPAECAPSADVAMLRVDVAPEASTREAVLSLL